MHASLAYLSLETRTLDAIITIAHPPPILPAEILLLIRTQLLTTVTTHLIHQGFDWEKHVIRLVRH
ncbi:hypothetical protein PQX77_019875 [Marasmius sp. AFHP31]|nr:hypothetical protein PQX77_019875 [Marasmius sp. AFHP31]